MKAVLLRTQNDILFISEFQISLAFLVM